MAFLDNSGDIILDAVLTDAGRKRLAQGDGSFKITKFAFGDDEIDYTSFDGNHASGSAYYDLEILQTPIFEAFTNNTSNMKTKLVSLTNNNLLFLPVIKLSEYSKAAQSDDGTVFGSGSHVLFVDKDTRTALNDSSYLNGEVDNTDGFINGYQTTDFTGPHIRLDQGLDTDEISPDFSIDPELKETQYLVEVDSRLIRLYDLGNSALAQVSFIDDDLIASYYFTQNVGEYISNLSTGEAGDTGVTPGDADTIAGPRGTKLRLGVLAALDIVSSDYLFGTIGTTTNDVVGGNSFAFIDTSIRITGVTTGYRVDVPLRILKIQD
tara:strand:- start:1438 stop:2403 length:966 start_codon:yes stop_codon:yes gene_type:complete